MQTLGLSDSTPHTENRLKSLFWPSIQTGADVDYLGTQGYWVCTLVGAATFVFSAITGHPIVGVIVLVFYYVGGVGVRERSRYAAAIVFVIYLLDAFAGGIGVVRVILTALLLSNLRATLIAAKWRPESEEAALPPRLSENWRDKLVDQFPMWLWAESTNFVLYFLGRRADFDSDRGRLHNLPACLMNFWLRTQIFSRNKSVSSASISGKFLLS